MKIPPTNPEFARFTQAMRGIMRVSKEKLLDELAQQKAKFEPAK